MKKMALGLLVLSIASVATANDNFTGWFIGAGIHATKHTFSTPNSSIHLNQAGEFSAKGSHKASVSVNGGYGFELGNSNIVGQVEGTIRSGGSKTKQGSATVSKETSSASIAYLQGYRATPEVMPYVKVSANSSSFDTNSAEVCATRCTISHSSARGIGVGGGVKYTLNPNVEVGAEYHKAYLKGRNEIKTKVTTLSANIAYRF